MVSRGDVCDEDSCADRTKMCWLADAFKGRFRQGISRCVCTAWGANTLKVHTGLSIAAGQSLTGRGQGDILSPRFTPQKRHPIWIDNVDFLQGWYLKDEESFVLLKTFADNDVTLTLYDLWSISSMSVSGCWLWSCPRQRAVVLTMELSILYH